MIIVLIITSAIFYSKPVALTISCNQVLEKNESGVTITASDTAVPTTTVNVNGSLPSPTTDSKDRTQRLNKLTK